MAFLYRDQYYRGEDWLWNCGGSGVTNEDIDDDGQGSNDYNSVSGDNDGSAGNDDTNDNEMDCTYNCTDTKNLFGYPIDLFNEATILSFQGKSFTFLNTSMNELWKPVDFVYDVANTKDEYPLVALCYEFVIPENVQSQGVKLIQIVPKKNFIGFMKLSPPGFLYQNSDVTATKILGERFLEGYRKYTVDLEYQVDNFLKIGEEPCNPDPSYSRDKCVIDQMLEYSKKLHGCIPPAFGNYGLQACKNGSHETISEVDALIDCMMPCTLFKMRSRTTVEDYNNLHYGWSGKWIEVRFKELITVTDDQYSYIWLNLVAEAGGYVGLFLGYSVFQLTDLMDVLFQRKWFGFIKAAVNKNSNKVENFNQ